MDGLLSEKEQIEAIRTWWQDNGLYIVAGVVLGVAILVGWNYWNSQKEEAATQASTLYEALVADVADVEVEDAEAKAASLYAGYGETAYAQQARLAMAKLYMNVGRDQDAADELAGLLAGGGESELQMVGRLRLAKILLYQEKPQEAVDLLQGHGDTAFAARYSEALGDAYTALGRFREARDAYAAALAGNPQAPTVDTTLVQMKINDLPPVAEEPPAPDEASPAAAEGPAATADRPRDPGDAPAEPADDEPPAEVDE